VGDDQSGQAAASGLADLFESEERRTGHELIAA
jgi:hypothetical protein